MTWVREITNDPRHDYRLVFEIWEDEEHRAQIEFDDAGQLVLTVFPSEQPYQIPVEWLVKLLNQATQELRPD